MKKFRIGRIHADYITLPEVLDSIEKLMVSQNGGFVVTPNVDHVVQAEKNELLYEAYRHAALSLADGMPIIWMSAILGHPLPEKISGSDLVRPLLVRAAALQMRVYFLGSASGVARKAKDILCAQIPGLNIVGIDSPPIGFDEQSDLEQKIMEKIIAAKANLVLVALGCPKQELLMYRWYERLAPAVMLGIGASLDFIAGHIRRSPRWMSSAGMEWVFRIFQDPKRLTKRYLIDDAAILPVFYRMLKTPKSERIFFDQ